MLLTHELWESIDPVTGAVCHAFFLAKNRATQPLEPGAKLIWTVEANSHAEAMSKFYEHMNWRIYKAMSVEDWKPY